MRAHAHVERHIQRLKDSGLCRMPFTSFEANANWMMTVAIAADLVRWFQLLCFDGTWTRPVRRRCAGASSTLPGRLVRRSRQLIVRIIDGWPATEALAHRLPAHRRDHLTSLSTPPVGTSLTTRAPNDLIGSASDPLEDRNAGHDIGDDTEIGDALAHATRFMASRGSPGFLVNDR